MSRSTATGGLGHCRRGNASGRRCPCRFAVPYISKKEKITKVAKLSCMTPAIFALLVNFFFFVVYGTVRPFRRSRD